MTKHSDIQKRIVAHEASHVLHSIKNDCRRHNYQIFVATRLEAIDVT